LPASGLQHRVLQAFQDAGGGNLGPAGGQRRFLRRQVCQSIVLDRGELRAHIRPTHACGGIILRVCYPVGVVTFDQRAIGRHDVVQASRHVCIEITGVQVCPYLAHDETGPGVK